MLRYLNRPAEDTVFLVLGRDCNLNCRYCLQHEVRERTEEALPSRRVIEFVRELASRRRRGSPLQLQFYGGEPLVYLRAISHTVAALEDANVTFTTITNGRLIDEGLVEYLNARFGGVAVSWDGYASTATRGYDVVADNGRNLLRVEHLTLTGVLSSALYPRDFLDAVTEFNASYEELHGYPVNFNLDELLSVNAEHPELKDFDYEELEDQVRALCEAYADYSVLLANKDASAEGINPFYVKYVQRKVGAVRYGANNPEVSRARCSNGYTTVNVDLEGNLYSCHNVPLRVGTVDDDWLSVLANVVRLDRTEVNNLECAACPVQVGCRNGCPLVPSEARREWYCEQVRRVYGPVIETVLRLGREVVPNGHERQPVSDGVCPHHGGDEPHQDY